MKDYGIYEFTEVSSDVLMYQFVSLGPKGMIKKVVNFERTYDNHIFNLAFGNVNEDGSIDDLSRNDNGDRNKILATVIAIITQFTSLRPDSYIFIFGSTPARTRLYRMAISLNYEVLTKTFYIWGLIKTRGSELFDGTQQYDGFLIKRK